MLQLRSLDEIKTGASLEWGIYFMRVFLFSQWLFFF